MREQWKVHLVYTDDTSNKFWRGRVDGSTMYLNYGRAGSDGQTSVKELGSATAAEDALDKQAASKRKKGYVDAELEAEASAPAPPPGEPAGPSRVTMTMQRGGRTVEVTLGLEGAAVRTEVREAYASEDAAQAAFTRICQAMEAEGYQRATGSS